MDTNDDSADKRLDEAEKDGVRLEAAPQAGQNRVAAVGGLTDQPPIIIGGGSLFIDFPSDIRIVLDTAAGSPRPVRYKQKPGDTPIRAIGRIKVLRLKSSGGNPVELFERDRITEAFNSQLHIWLEQLNAAETDFEPVFPPDPQLPRDPTVPQIIIKGPPFSIEVDKEIIGPSKSFKSRAPNRFRHFGYTGRHFRIGRWMLFGTDNGSPIIIGDQSGDDDYLIHISFWHS